jgi:agmatinase
MSEFYVEDPLTFWCSNYGLSGAGVVFLGVPFDGTSTGRVGSREAPNRIRAMSYNLETYSHALKKDLAELKMLDYGNVIVSPGDTDESLKRIQRTVRDIADKFPVLVGGEHIITLSAVKALLRKHPDMKVLQLDAHLDLKDEYLGNRYSHVTVMRRLVEVLGKDNVFQVGARSFSPDEKEFADKNTKVRTLEWLKGFESRKPVYITIDMDVFDPSFAPGVSTPEPEGMSPERYFEIIKTLKNRLDVIGFDVVETCPPHDSGDMTSLLAAKVIKETLLAFGNE